MLPVIAMGWMFVVLLVALAEATSPQGTLLGAFFTVLLWGLLPLAIVLYVLATPARRRAAARRESAADPGHPDHAAADPVAAEREEP